MSDHASTMPGAPHVFYFQNMKGGSIIQAGRVSKFESLEIIVDDGKSGSLKHIKTLLFENIQISNQT